MPPHVLKRFVGYLAALLICCFLADRGFAMLLEPLIRQSEARFSRLYRGGLQEEVLILGNSRAVNAFYAPEMEKRTGMSVVNMAYNGMSMPVAEAIFMDYLEHNQAPRLLLLEVTNLNVPSDLLKDLRIYSGMSERLTALLETYDPQLARVAGWVHTYRFNAEMFLRVLFYLGKDDQDWVNSGQLPEDYQLPPPIEPLHFPLSTEGPGWDALSRILSHCQTHQIEVELVVSPYFRPYAEHLKERATRIEQFTRALPAGVDFYDGSHAVEGTDFFADPIHLNRKGSLEFLEGFWDEGMGQIRP